MEVLPLCWYVGLVPSPFVPPIAQLEAQLYDLLQASVGVDSPQVTAARLLELLGRHPGELSVLPTPDAPNSGELAAKKRHGSLLTAAIRHANNEVEALRAVEVLLGRGCSPTATATPAMTPLVWAVRRTFFAVADLLMEAGAAVDSWEVFDSVLQHGQSSAPAAAGAGLQWHLNATTFSYLIRNATRAVFEDARAKDAVRLILTAWKRLCAAVSPDDAAAPRRRRPNLVCQGPEVGRMLLVARQAGLPALAPGEWAEFAADPHAHEWEEAATGPCVWSHEAHRGLRGGFKEAARAVLLCAHRGPHVRNPDGSISVLFLPSSVAQRIVECMAARSMAEWAPTTRSEVVMEKRGAERGSWMRPLAPSDRSGSEHGEFSRRGSSSASTSSSGRGGGGGGSLRRSRPGSFTSTSSGGSLWRGASGGPFGPHASFQGSSSGVAPGPGPSRMWAWDGGLFYDMSGGGGGHGGGSGALDRWASLWGAASFDRCLSSSSDGSSFYRDGSFYRAASSSGRASSFGLSSGSSGSLGGSSAGSLRF